MNKEEHIRVITDKEELYDKCDNMEQLYDKYYLPLLCKHYDTTYKLQQENKGLKQINEEHQKLNGELREKMNKLADYVRNQISLVGVDKNYIYIEILDEMEKLIK